MDSSQLHLSLSGKRKRDSATPDDHGEEKLFLTQMSNDSGIGDADSNDDNKDADDEDDSETEDAAYNETMESFPDCAAYDPRFSEISERLTKLALAAKVVLDGQKCITDDVEKLRKRADEVSTIPSARRLMIGLLGGAGEGKSSLVNCITDTPDLAKALDGGQSCTYVATLYRGALSTQTKDFSATIEYFNLETIGKLLADSIGHWVTWRFENDPTWTNEIRQQHQRRANTCLTTFRAIFCKDPAFSDGESAQNSLDYLAAQEREEQVRIHVDLAAEQLEERQQPNGRYEDYYETDTQDELRRIIDPLVTESSKYDEVSLWPFVKKVSIGVRKSRVLEYITIADLPGVSDTNQVRVKATVEHIDQCDEIWLISRSGRIITDTMLDGLMQQYGKPNRGHMAVIATKSDENVDHQLALNLSEKGYPLGDYARLKKEVQDIGRQIAKMKKRKSAAKKREEKTDLQDEIERLEESQQSLDSQRFGLVVGARNTHIKTLLQREKQDHMPQGITLDVFCVSNHHYSGHKGTADISGPLLDVDMTGIPALRAFLLGLAAPKVLRALEDFTMHDFSVFFKGLDLWASQRLIEGRADLLKIVERPKKTVTSMINIYIESLEDLTFVKILAPLEKEQDSLVRCALAALEQLKSWHFSTFKAFIKKYGQHSTSAMPHQSWNQNFTQASTKVIFELWESFIEKQDSLIEQMQDELVTGEPATVALPMKIFEDAIAAHVQGIRNLFRDYQEAMAKDLRTIFLNATSDRDDSFFDQTMAECYDSCMNDSGSGVKERCIATFRTHLSLTGDRSPFAEMARSTQAAILDAANTASNSLQEDVDGILDAIVQQFELMVSQKNVDESEIPVRNAVREFLVTGNPKFEEIKEDFQALKGSFGT